MPKARSILMFLVFSGVALTASAGSWTNLKVGMSATQTMLLLGEPILRSAGHGFERWTYDDGAEVLLFTDGSVLGWTAPASLVLDERSVDIWSRQPAGRRYGTMHAVLPRPLAKRTTATAETASAGGTYESYLRS